MCVIAITCRATVRRSRSYESSSRPSAGWAAANASALITGHRPLRPAGARAPQDRTAQSGGDPSRRIVNHEDLPADLQVFTCVVPSVQRLHSVV
jgi:hypothetical protein